MVNKNEKNKHEGLGGREGWRRGEGGAGMVLRLVMGGGRRVGLFICGHRSLLLSFHGLLRLPSSCQKKKTSDAEKATLISHESGTLFATRPTPV